MLRFFIASLLFVLFQLVPSISPLKQTIRILSLSKPLLKCFQNSQNINHLHHSVYETLFLTIFRTFWGRPVGQAALKRLDITVRTPGITCGLYVFFPIFEVHFFVFKEFFFFIKFCPYVWLVVKSGFLSRAGLMARVRWLLFTA